MGKCLESNLFLKGFMEKKKPKNHLAVSELDESEFWGILKWLDTVLYLCSWLHLQQEHLPQLSAEWEQQGHGSGRGSAPRGTNSKSWLQAAGNLLRTDTR